MRRILIWFWLIQVMCIRLLGGFVQDTNELSRKGDLDSSIPSDTKTTESTPDSAVAYYNRGTAKAKKGDFDGAIADFTRAIRLKPDFTEAYYNRGKAKDGKGDFEGAIDDFTWAIEFKPDYAEAYGDRGLEKKKKSKARQSSIIKGQSANVTFSIRNRSRSTPCAALAAASAANGSLNPVSA